MDSPVYMFAAVDNTLNYLWRKAGLLTEKDKSTMFCETDCLPAILLSLSVSLSSTTQVYDQARFFRVYTGTFYRLMMCFFFVKI